MPRINRTYLMDRVNAEVSKRLTVVDGDARSEQERIKKEFVEKHAPKTVGSSLTKRKAKIEKLQKQVEALDAEQKLEKAALLDNFPFLDYGYDAKGKIVWSLRTESAAYWRDDREVKWPEPLKKALKHQRDIATAEGTRLRTLSTIFTDKVMMGEATFEDFAALLAKLDD